MKVNKEKVQNAKFVKFLKKYWIPIAAVIVVITVTVSSVGIYKEEVLHIDPGVEYEKGDRLYLASNPFDTLNPVTSASADTYYLSKLIYNSLFDYTDTFGVTPELVESYTVDTEKATVDITLKSGIKWHDGSALTSKDVRFTINAIKSYGKKGIYYDKAAKIRYVSIDGDLNLTIQFRNKNEGTLDDLTFPVLPDSQYSSIGKFLGDKENFVPVGTGQYKYKSYNYLEQLQLEPNPAYFGSVAPQEIYVAILPDKSLAPNMMEIDAVTCYADDDPDRRSLVLDKNFKMYDMISNDVEFMVFNQNRAPFNKKIARQAAAYSIDIKNILKKGYMNDGVLADNLYYPGFLGVPETQTHYLKDIQKAKTLFAQAGYKDRDMNGKLTDSKNKEAAITILVNSDNAMRSGAAKLIAKDLDSVGFLTTVKSVPWAEYIKLIEKKDFDILITGYNMQASYDLRTFFDGTNLWQYKNEELLKHATELEKLYSADKYAELYKDLKTRMLDELPYYTICYKKMGLIGIEYFEAPATPTFDDIYRNCSTWTWKKVKETQKNE